MLPLTEKTNGSFIRHRRATHVFAEHTSSCWSVGHRCFPIRHKKSKQTVQQWNTSVQNRRKLRRSSSVKSECLSRISFIHSDPTLRSPPVFPLQLDTQRQHRQWQTSSYGLKPLMPFWPTRTQTSRYFRFCIVALPRSKKRFLLCWLSLKRRNSDRDDNLRFGPIRREKRDSARSFFVYASVSKTRQKVQFELIFTSS